MFSVACHIYVYKSYGMQANFKVGHSCLPQCNHNYSLALSQRKDPSGSLVNRLNLCGAEEVEVLNVVPWMGGSEEDRDKHELCLTLASGCSGQRSHRGVG